MPNLMNLAALCGLWRRDGFKGIRVRRINRNILGFIDRCVANRNYEVSGDD